MFADTFHDTYAEAMKEAHRRKVDGGENQVITKIEKSGYGGFRVRSTPIEMVIDDLMEGPTSPLGRFRSLSSMSV